MREEVNVIIEGLEIHKLIQGLADDGIELRDIKYISGDKIQLRCLKKDASRIDKFARNKYIVTVAEERGPITMLARLKNRKATIAGVIIFAAVLFYQSLFISKIEINGLESINEIDVYEVLEDNGVYIGCKRGDYDLEAIEYDIFDRVKGIAWMELHNEGGVVTVDLVESVKAEITEPNQPQNIVAQKEGYIEEVIAINGKTVVTKGQFVNPGDVLISGEIQNRIDETIYRYVPAEGHVYAKCIYMLTRTENKSVEEYICTGKYFPGIYLKFGDFIFDSSEFMNSFEEYYLTEQILMDIKVPLPVKLSFIGINETALIERERTVAEMKRTGEIEMLKELKKNIGDTGKIVNKNLQFKEEENIIEMIGIFEVIEEIGGEEPIIYERTQDQNR